MGKMGGIGLIGGGNMGSALIKGILAAGLAEPSDVVVAEKLDSCRQVLNAELGVETVCGADELSGADVLILAVKPPDAAPALKAAAEKMGPDCLVMSLAAGITLKTLAGVSPPGQPLVRAMPNTPALISKGATALSMGDSVSPEQAEKAREIFGAVGEVVELPEKLLDAVTGLSGSGPAYVFLLMEAMINAGVSQGLPIDAARTLVGATFEGAAALMSHTEKHPAALKDMVTSPGGTTAAGLALLERRAVRGAIMEAVAAATERSKELAGS